VQQAALGHQVAVVCVVEDELRLRVERRQVAGAGGGRGGAAALAQRGEGRVDVGVVVDVVAEVLALREADGVRARERREVGRAQLLLAERTDEPVEV
jgi:hypothetical protein